MTMYDASAKNAQGIAGTLGATDKLAITVYRNAGGMWYSSSWDGTRTVEADVCGTAATASTVSVTGNNVGTMSTTTSPSIAVTGVPTLDVAPPAGPVVRDDKLTVNAYPNPSISQFNLKLGSNSTQGISVRVTDISGRLIEVKQSLFPGQTIQIGGAYRSGVYIVDVIQGNNRKQVKIIKSN
jgi:hypothetical protein